MSTGFKTGTRQNTRLYYTPNALINKRVIQYWSDYANVIREGGYFVTRKDDTHYKPLENH